MCLTIYIGEKEIETYGEFKEHFGFEPILDEHIIEESEPKSGECLCWYDLPKTFEQNNIKFMFDENSYDLIILEEKWWLRKIKNGK